MVLNKNKINASFPAFQLKQPTYEKCQTSNF
jgi:hypothetical protein